MGKVMISRELASKVILHNGYMTRNYCYVLSKGVRTGLPVIKRIGKECIGWTSSLDHENWSICEWKVGD